MAIVDYSLLLVIIMKCRTSTNDILVHTHREFYQVYITEPFVSVTQPM